MANFIIYLIKNLIDFRKFIEFKVFIIYQFYLIIKFMNLYLNSNQKRDMAKLIMVIMP